MSGKDTRKKYAEEMERTRDEQGAWSVIDLCEDNGRLHLSEYAARNCSGSFIVHSFVCSLFQSFFFRFASCIRNAVLMAFPIQHLLPSCASFITSPPAQ